MALAMTTFGTVQARANGWPIAGAAIGGLAVGTAVGATIATAAQPAYYTYPAGYYGPSAVCAPAPVTVAAGPYYYGPRFYAGPYPYYHPYFRGGWGWGHGYYRGGPYHRR